MTSRTFTVFQDLPADEVIKAKKPTSNGMTTRSSSGSNSKLSKSPASNEHIPTDKENVNPLTGERAGTAAMSKKRKTTVLADKSSAHLALKTAKDSQLPKKRKAGSKGKQSKEVVSKEGKAIGSTRKTTRRGAHKVSRLPRLEEEIISQTQEIEHFTQASIDSRCYDLMVQPLADVSQAYEAIESAVDILASPVTKANFRKVMPSFMCLTLLTSHLRTRHWSRTYVTFSHKHLPLCPPLPLRLQKPARSEDSLRQNANRFMPRLHSLHLLHPVSASNLCQDLTAFLAWSWHDLEALSQSSSLIETALYCQSLLPFNTSSYRTIFTGLSSSSLHYNFDSLHLIHVSYLNLTHLDRYKSCYQCHWDFRSPSGDWFIIYTSDWLLISYPLPISDAINICPKNEHK